MTEEHSPQTGTSKTPEEEFREVETGDPPKDSKAVIRKMLEELSRGRIKAARRHREGPNGAGEHDA